MLHLDPLINVHHLELFYYVARFRGVSAAARRMPYGIGQPALSAQMRSLEGHYGTLFLRSPFQLTPAGKELYACLKPFFEKLQAVTRKLRRSSLRTLRLAASPLVLRDYFPAILERICRQFPDLHFTLTEGQQPQIEEWFESGELDFAVTILQDKVPAGCHSMPLLQLPVALLSRADAAMPSPRDLWSKGSLVAHELVAPAANDPITRSFRKGMAKRASRWATRMTVNSIELVESLVERGFGLGLSVAVPGRTLSPGLRLMPLNGFPPLKVSAVWQGPLNEVTTAILKELKIEARHLKDLKGGVAGSRQ